MLRSIRLPLLALASAAVFAVQAQEERPAPAPKVNYAPEFPAGSYILTPKPSPEPRINGACIFGVRPGSPFLFSVAATGEAPLKYTAENLPAGLTLDAASGHITGVIKSRKNTTCKVRLHVTNARGSAKRELRIVVGDQIALTPPMGWNSWNCWGSSVDEAKVRATAEAMAQLLKGHGWTYVNIDDAWQGKRGGPLNAIQPDKKFPDVKKLSDDVHALGLKLGIYSTPWITSYGSRVGGSADNKEGAWVRPTNHQAKLASRRIGKYTFDFSDARQWTEWGIDYVKYDWNPNDLPSTTRMSKALAKQSRDIVYSLSNGSPFQNASHYERLANAWRTTGDIRDAWANRGQYREGFMGIYDIWLLQERWAPFTGPGHWPDPDMLVVGKVGWGTNLHSSKLTADEQYTHISLWCMWSAPLLIGCPINGMDDFTLNLLSNDEVLAVNQDPLGRMATTILSDGNAQVLAKPLEDNSVVVGLFNRGDEAQPVGVPWSLLIFNGLPELSKLWEYDQTDGRHASAFQCQVRDLWRQKDVGVFAGQFTAMVPPHGVVLIRAIPQPAQEE